ncbi:hypothetical protein EV714DRAFT_256016 [Schizophyllum commune]
MEGIARMDFHRSYDGLRKIRDLALQLTNDLPARAHASALAKIKSLFGIAFRLFLIDARVQSLSRTTDRTRTYDLVLGGFFAFGALWNATKLPRNASLTPLLRDLPSSLVKWAAIVHPVRAPPPDDEEKRVVLALTEFYIVILQSDTQYAKSFVHANPDLASQIVELWIRFPHSFRLAAPHSDSDVDIASVVFGIVTAMCRLYVLLARPGSNPSEDDRALFTNALRAARVTKRALYDVIGPQTHYLARSVPDHMLMRGVWLHYIDVVSGLVQLPEFQPSKIPRDIIPFVIMAAGVRLEKKDYMSTAELLAFTDIICGLAHTNRPLIQAIKSGVFVVLYTLDRAPEDLRIDVSPLVRRLSAGLVHGKVLRALRHTYAPGKDLKDHSAEEKPTWRSLMRTYENFGQIHFNYCTEGLWRRSIPCQNSMGPHNEVVRFCPCGDVLYCSGSCQRMHWDRSHGYNCHVDNGPWDLKGAISLSDVVLLCCIARRCVESMRSEIGEQITTKIQEKEEGSRFARVTIVCNFANVLPSPRIECHYDITADQHAQISHETQRRIFVEGSLLLGRKVVRRRLPLTYALDYFCSLKQLLPYL